MENQLADESQFESGYSSEPTETPEPVKQPEKKQEEQKEKSEANPVEQIDPLKELMARFDKFEASHNNLAGHIGGLQRSQKEIQERLAAAQAATKTVNDAPTQAEVKDAMTDPQEWADLKTAYPEWASATEKIIDAKVGTQPKIDPAEIDKMVSERVAREAASTRQEMIDSHLDAIVDGDWLSEVKSEKFGKWIDGQNEDIKALANSSKMTDAAKMLRLFQISKQTKPEQKIEPKPKEISPRQKRIEASVNPRGTGGHASSTTDMDEFEAGYSS